MKNDSFWALASARLVDFVLWANFDHTEVEFLNRVRLGRGLGPFAETEQVAHRFFENGLIVLNDSPQDREIELRVPDDLAHAPLVDLYDGRAIAPPDQGAMKVKVGSKMARILVKDGTK
jgi:hypothetical protein